LFRLGTEISNGPWRDYKKAMSDSGRVAEESAISIIEKLIARDLGIDPSEVTPEFIHRWRQEHLYSNAQHGLNTKYGGYNGSGRQILSESEVQKVRESAERFIESVSKTSNRENPEVDD